MMQSPAKRIVPGLLGEAHAGETGGNGESVPPFPIRSVPFSIRLSRCGARSVWPLMIPVRIDFVVGVTESRDAALALVEKYRNPHTADQSFDLARSTKSTRASMPRKPSSKSMNNWPAL